MTVASGPTPDVIITAGHPIKTARTVAFRQGDPINAPALTAMLQHIIATNRAGGWRELKSWHAWLLREATPT